MRTPCLSGSLIGIAAGLVLGSAARADYVCVGDRPGPSTERVVVRLVLDDAGTVKTGELRWVPARVAEDGIDPTLLYDLPGGQLQGASLTGLDMRTSIRVNGNAAPARLFFAVQVGDGAISVKELTEYAEALRSPTGLPRGPFAGGLVLRSGDPEMAQLFADLAATSTGALKTFLVTDTGARLLGTAYALLDPGPQNRMAVQAMAEARAKLPAYQRQCEQVRN